MKKKAEIQSFFPVDFLRLQRVVEQYAFEIDPSTSFGMDCFLREYIM